MRKRIKIPIYNQYFYLVVTDEENENYMAWVDVVDGMLTATFIKDHVSDGIIVHESVHLVNFLYERVGAKLDIINDEHQAYLTQWFFETIKKNLK